MEKLTKDEVSKEVFKLLKPEAIPIDLDSFEFKVPGFFTAESVSEANSLTLYPDDVWIVTCPKAGTTWAQQIVKLIRNNGVNDGQLLPASVPWPAMNNGIIAPKFDLAALPRPRSFKSHMPYNTMIGGPPHTLPCKYIYIARNPKDTIVSYYHHMYRGYVKHDENVVFPWDLYFRYFMLGCGEFGDFFDHVLSWWAHKDDANVLFLKYEDMKRDLPAAVARMAKFIGADISEEVVAKVVSQTTFDAMKTDDTSNYSFINSLHKPGTGTFMRKGEVGDWKNHFTADQSAEVDEMCQKRFAGTGIVFDF